MIITSTINHLSSDLLCLQTASTPTSILCHLFPPSPSLLLISSPNYLLCCKTHFILDLVCYSHLINSFSELVPPERIAEFILQFQKTFCYNTAPGETLRNALMRLRCAAERRYEPRLRASSWVWRSLHSWRAAGRAGVKTDVSVFFRIPLSKLIFKL